MCELGCVQELSPLSEDETSRPNCGRYPVAWTGVITETKNLEELGHLFKSYYYIFFKIIFYELAYIDMLLVVISDVFVIIIN